MSCVHVYLFFQVCRANIYPPERTPPPPPNEGYKYMALCVKQLMESGEWAEWWGGSVAVLV